MSILELVRISHAYLGRAVLEDVSLRIRAGEMVAVVGPSGCGKSTLAHVAAGLLTPRSGRVRRGYRRHAMIFQQPGLMHWADAAANIALPLRLAGIPARLRRARVEEVAQQVALEPGDLAKYPSELSGGMKQRVAIARALIAAPDFIYLDEPFTALDVALKRRMQDLVIDACRSRGLAGMFITHDLSEAARVAARIAVLDTRGHGIVGERTLPDHGQTPDDRWLFDWTQAARDSDPVFSHIHDVDERQIP